MPLAVLIGFEYQDNNMHDTSTFPGTIVDLHRVYKFCGMSGMNVVIITDITREKFPEGIMEPITSGSINPSIMSFMSTVSSDMKKIKTGKELLQTLINVLHIHSKEDKFFIYYSGHGVNSGITTPNNERIEYLDFRKIITTHTCDKSQIMIVLDCCHPTNLFLPCTLHIAENKSNKLLDKISSSADVIKSIKQKTRFHINESYIPCKQDIVLITSATIDEKSVATQYGSLFSQYFFSYLTTLTSRTSDTGKATEIPSRHFVDIKYNVDDNMKKHKHQQTMMIHSSILLPPMLWCWIGPMVHEIRVDMNSKSIYIRRLNEND